MRPKKLITPIFWVTVTYTAVTYGPEIVPWVKALLNPEEAAVERQATETFQAVLGEGGGALVTGPPVEKEASESKEADEESASEPSPTPGVELPQYIKEIIEKTTVQVIEKSSQEVVQKKEQVTTSVCRELLSEIEKQCQAIADNED